MPSFSVNGLVYANWTKMETLEKLLVLHVLSLRTGDKILTKETFCWKVFLNRFIVDSLIANLLIFCCGVKL